MMMMMMMIDVAKHPSPNRTQIINREPPYHRQGRGEPKRKARGWGVGARACQPFLKRGWGGGGVAAGRTV